jgi:hypothetical protein
MQSSCENINIIYTSFLSIFLKLDKWDMFIAMRNFEEETSDPKSVLVFTIYSRGL